LFGTALQLVDKSFCLSAAKKKEYEAFSLFRQLLFFLHRRFDDPKFLFLLTNFSGRRTIAKRTLPWQGFFAAMQHVPDGSQTTDTR
jgi:hypothetical protein